MAFNSESSANLSVSCFGHISAITRLQLTWIKFNKTSCLFCVWRIKMSRSSRLRNIKPCLQKRKPDNFKRLHQGNVTLVPTCGSYNIKDIYKLKCGRSLTHSLVMLLYIVDNVLSKTRVITIIITIMWASLFLFLIVINNIMKTKSWIRKGVVDKEIRDCVKIYTLFTFFFIYIYKWFLLLFPFWEFSRSGNKCLSIPGKSFILSPKVKGNSSATKQKKPRTRTTRMSNYWSTHTAQCVSFYSIIKEYLISDGLLGQRYSRSLTLCTRCCNMATIITFLITSK